MLSRTDQMLMQTTCMVRILQIISVSAIFVGIAINVPVLVGTATLALVLLSIGGGKRQPVRLDPATLPPILQE